MFPGVVSVVNPHPGARCSPRSRRPKLERRKPLRIEVPKEDRPQFGRVGAIALLGFVVGVAWPHLAGLRVVPRAPTPASEASANDLTGAPAPVASGEARAGKSQPEAPAPAPAAAQEPFIIGAGEVTSCRDSEGKRLGTCDPIEFEPVARGRLATLAACGAARRARGILSVGFELDFERDRVVGVQLGKSTTVSDQEARELLGCLNETLGEVSLSNIAHAHARYVVFYRLEFTDQPSATDPVAAAAPAAVTPASGRATVSWDVALVRSGPSRDDSVVARVLSGTRVTVTGRQGDWYRVKYDGKGAEGWVFRTAIGM